MELLLHIRHNPQDKTQIIQCASRTHLSNLQKIEEELTSSGVPKWSRFPSIYFVSTFFYFVWKGCSPLPLLATLANILIMFRKYISKILHGCCLQRNERKFKIVCLFPIFLLTFNIPFMKWQNIMPRVTQYQNFNSRTDLSDNRIPLLHVVSFIRWRSYCCWIARNGKVAWCA